MFDKNTAALPVKNLWQGTCILCNCRPVRLNCESAHTVCMCVYVCVCVRACVRERKRAPRFLSLSPTVGSQICFSECTKFSKPALFQLSWVQTSFLFPLQEAEEEPTIRHVVFSDSNGFTDSFWQGNTVLVPCGLWRWRFWWELPHAGKEAGTPRLRSPREHGVKGYRSWDVCF